MPLPVPGCTLCVPCFVVGRFAVNANVAAIWIQSMSSTCGEGPVIVGAVVSQLCYYLVTRTAPRVCTIADDCLPPSDQTICAFSFFLRDIFEIHLSREWSNGTIPYDIRGMVDCYHAIPLSLSRQFGSWSRHVSFVHEHRTWALHMRANVNDWLYRSYIYHSQ